MIPATIQAKVGKGLHKKEGHPLRTIKNKIYQTFYGFQVHDSLDPKVSVADNFDSLLIPPEHPSRQDSDTYYFDKDHVLRTHTSAHQNQLLREYASKPFVQFLVTGDVFRKDEIDRFHYPVFHQMEGVFVAPWSKEKVECDLHDTMQEMIKNLFGQDVKYRVVESYFPFTDPSWEYEVFWGDKWVEVLGCGGVQNKILENCGITDGRHGWAFGLGLERLAMILFDIPDIRLFWTEDPRFHSQFKNDEIVKFQPYSNHPACLKDVTFWLSDKFNQNEFYQLVRDMAGDFVEGVVLIDSFEKNGRTSHCYRISYRANDRTLTNEEINAVQDKVRETTRNRFGVELR